MGITLKFIGALRHVSGNEKIFLDYKEEKSIIELIKFLNRQIPDLRRNIIDEQFNDARTNALILVNGREISALEGLETILKDGDEIVFVPVVHGG
jgi:molybdopterin synthase sulfur carrier subunit